MEEQDLRSDEELFQAWRKGELESFRVLLARYHWRLHKLILCWTRNAQLSQDLFQETWFRVIEHRQDFDPDRKFKSWLYAIALNLCRDHFRKEKREKTDLAPELIARAIGRENPETALIEKDRRQWLERAIAELSELEREVFMLRHFGGMTFQEISDLLGINLNTALSRMHQAMGRLKHLLGEKP